ncbi:MAG: rod-binding protein [Acidobacteriota bacterium]
MAGIEMSPLKGGAAVSAPNGDGTPKPKNAGEAAKQFEALLLGQMLRSARSSEVSEDPTGETMWDMAAQHFAQVMADNGGMGLAKMIARSLETKPQTAPIGR